MWEAENGQEMASEVESQEIGVRRYMDVRVSLDMLGELTLGAIQELKL